MVTTFGSCVKSLLHQLTFLSYDSEVCHVCGVINAHEYFNYEMEYDSNNSHERIDEEFFDMYSS